MIPLAALVLALAAPSFEPRDCPAPLAGHARCVVAFLDRAEPGAIDADCVATMRPPPFAIELPVR